MKVVLIHSLASCRQVSRRERRVLRITHIPSIDAERERAVLVQRDTLQRTVSGSSFGNLGVPEREITGSHKLRQKGPTCLLPGSTLREQQHPGVAQQSRPTCQAT